MWCYSQKSHCVFSVIKCIVSSAVKLNPPTNLTVQKQSDSYLSYYWNQTSTNCVESEVRYRVNCGQWQVGNMKEEKRDSSLSSSLFSHSMLFYLFPSLLISFLFSISQISTVSIGREFFDLHSLCSNSQYELQVRSKIGNDCGESLFWSDWSEPVVWGSNSETACTDWMK